MAYAASWATLALRPVGAFSCSAAFSDRFGRRRPLVVNLMPFSPVVELLTAFTRTATCGVHSDHAGAVRHCDGRAVGAWARSLAMEKVPVRLSRGVERAVPAGVCAGVSVRGGARTSPSVAPKYGWHAAVLCGQPAGAGGGSVCGAFRVHESESWKQHQRRKLRCAGTHAGFQHWKLFVYFTDIHDVRCI